MLLWRMDEIRKMTLRNKGLTLSLKNKILLFNFLVFMVSLVCFFLVSFSYYTEKYINTEIEHSLMENRLIIKNIDMLVRFIEKFIRSASVDAKIQDGLNLMESVSDYQSIAKLHIDEVLGQSLGNVIVTNPELYGITIWYENSHLYSTYTIDDRTITNLFTKEYFSKASNSKTPYWDGLREIKDNYFVFPVTKAIISKETGYTIGALTLFLNELDISRVFEKIDSRQVDYFVVDGRNLQILSSENKHLILGNFLKESNLTEDEFEKIIKDQYLLKNNLLYCCEKYDKQDWIVVSIIDLGNFFNAERVQFMYFSLFLLLILLLVFFGAKVISISITKPLYQIIDVMKNIGEGDMKCRVDKRINDSELQAFAMAFNTLIDKLEYSMDKIFSNQQVLRQRDLQLVQAQVKPHFLYNILETISSFIKLGYKDKAIQTITNLSMLYRKSLSNGKDLITMNDELELVEHYLNLQKLRYNETIQWMVEIEQDCRMIIVPKLLIQPLIENCIYHGIKPAKRQAEIVVCCYIKKGNLIIEVHDTGVGIEKQKLALLQSYLTKGIETSGRKSFGLHSVNERLKLYFGDEAFLRLESVEGEYTLVFITIPMIKAQGYENSSS